MYGKPEYPPKGFVCADVATQLILGHLIATVPAFDGEHGCVRTFVDVLTNVLDGLDRIAKFDVDVGVEYSAEPRAVGHYPPVVDLVAAD